MIEISVSAIKGGFRELFLTSQNAPKGIASIIRPDSGSPYAVGQEVYAISFLESGLVCTKSKIIRDVMGGSRVGNVSISLLVPFGKKLSGKDIVNLLDDLLHEYNRQAIDKDNNLGNVYEDWSFFEAASSQCDPHKENTEIVKQGLEDAAFIYYTSAEELEKRFNNPYQEEFSNYRLIYFVKSELKEDHPENPLNALRHNPYSDLTMKIDWENPKYTLFFNSNAKNDLKTTVKVFGKATYSGSEIRRKDEIEIVYSRKFHKEKIINGKLYEIEPQFLVIDYKKATIQEIKLTPITYTFKFITINSNRNQESNAEVILTCKHCFDERKATGNQIELTEEEIQYKWIVVAKKDGLTSVPREIKIEDATGSVELILLEHRKVKILAKDQENGSTIENVKIHITEKNSYQVADEIEFVGDEIKKKWNIAVEHNDYIRSENKEFCPYKDGSEIKFELKKRQIREGQRNYYIDATRNGGRIKKGGPSWSSFTDGRDVLEYIEPPKGKLFQRFEFHAHARGFTYGAIVAIYKKDESPPPGIGKWLIISSIAIVLFTVIILMIVTYYNSKPPEHEDKLQIKKNIENYVENIVLNKETLEKYKENCAEYDEPLQDQNESTTITLGGGDSKQTEERFNLLCSKIDYALAIRIAINNGKIDELKNKTFSQNQNSFERAIDSIPDKFNGKIGQVMLADTISKMDLNQVAKYVTKLYNLLLIREEVSTLTRKDEAKLKSKKNEIEKIGFSVDSINNHIKEEIDKKLSKDNERKSVSTGGGPATNIPNNSLGGNISSGSIATASPSSDNLDSKIIEYLQGSELDKQRLEEYQRKKGISSFLQKSIQLCLDFWTLNGLEEGKRARTYCNSLEKVKNDAVLRNSKLKTFLNEMCTKKRENPSYNENYSEGFKKIGLK